MTVAGRSHMPNRSLSWFSCDGSHIYMYIISLSSSRLNWSGCNFTQRAIDNTCLWMVYFLVMTWFVTCSPLLKVLYSCRHGLEINTALWVCCLKRWLHVYSKQAWWRQWFRHVERKALQIHNLYVVVIKGTKNILHSLYAVVTLHGGIGRETHIHDISNTYMYVPFPQLFAKGKSLKFEGKGMPRDKNKGLHGLLGHNWAKLNQ
jgi:hypothetical protein